jgi:hypothetical protein
LAVARSANEPPRITVAFFPLVAGTVSGLPATTPALIEPGRACCSPVRAASRRPTPASERKTGNGDHAPGFVVIRGGRLADTATRRGEPAEILI